MSCEQTPHRCPLCFGTGQQTTIDTTAATMPCHGCNGTGIVWSPPRPSNYSYCPPPERTDATP